SWWFKNNEHEKTYDIPFSTNEIYYGISIDGMENGMTKFLFLNYSNIEPKTFEEAEMELENYSEEDRMKELEYLKSNIFYGLKNLNNGFDSESIYYFSESDFEIVLDRVEKNGLGIYGIEPWLNDDFYGVMVFEEFDTVATDPNWYRKAFSEYKKSGKKLL